MGGNLSIVRFTNVDKSYRSGFALRKKPVLHDISFELAPGEVFAYLGHNGAGKSTSVKAMLGLIGIDAGQIEVFGRRPGSRQALGRLGYLPENPYFYDHLTGEEFLQLVAQLCDLERGSRRARIAATLERVGMAANAKERLRSYSKGMLQRIGLAQAILNDPELLILDEPMGGLDPVGRAQMRSLIEELAAQGKTIFLCSHILADVEAVADRAAILSGGALRRIVDLKELRVEGRRLAIECRGLNEPASERLTRFGHEVNELGDSHRIVVDEQSAVAKVVAEIDAVGGRLLSVHPVRRSLEEIFLKEVGHVQPGQDPADVESTVSSLLDAVGESTHLRTSDEGSKSVEIPS
jgi:ABC-2 type transport system ATP-binding protein